MKQKKRSCALILTLALACGTITACNGVQFKINHQSTVSQNSEQKQESQASKQEGQTSKQESQPAEEKTELDYNKIATAVKDKTGLYKLNKDLGVKDTLNPLVINNKLVFEKYNSHDSDEGYDLEFYIYDPLNDSVEKKTITPTAYCTTSVYEERIVLCDTSNNIIYIYDCDLNYLGKLDIGQEFDTGIFFSPDFTKLYYFTWNENYQWNSEITMVDISKLSADTHMDTHKKTLIDTGLLNPMAGRRLSKDFLVVCGVEKNSYKSVRKCLSLENDEFVEMDIDVPAESTIQLLSDGRYFSMGYNTYINFGKSGETNTHVDYCCDDFFWDIDNNTVALVYTNYNTNTQEYINYDLTDGSALNELVFYMNQDENAQSSTKSYYSVLMQSYHAILIVETDIVTEDTVLYLWDLTATGETDAPQLKDTTEPQPVIEWGELKSTHERAVALGEKYGVEIYIGEECANQDGWSFNGDIVLDKNSIEIALNCLEISFENYPEGFIQQFKYSTYKKVKIYLTSSLQAAVEGTISRAGAYVSHESDFIRVVFALDELCCENVYHEFSHIIDTKLEFVSGYTSMNYSETAWSELNPSDFEYISYTEYDSGADVQYNKYIYENPADRYFVDTYSLTQATEDRARIIESTMGYWSLWDDNGIKTSNLYKKLKYYASCVKEVFETDSWNGDTLFEQAFINA